MVETAVSNELALSNRAALEAAGVFAVDLCGSPGCGKTTLIQATMDRLANRMKVEVVVAHRSAERDIAALRGHGGWAVPIGVNSLSAAVLQSTISGAVVDARRFDLLLIEETGKRDAQSPADLGQGARVAVFSVTGGDDKVAENPELVRAADLVLLTKTDLLPHVRFDRDVFRRDVRGYQPRAKIIELSSFAGQGMQRWIDWLTACALRTRVSGGMISAIENSEMWIG